VEQRLANRRNAFGLRGEGATLQSSGLRDHTTLRRKGLVVKHCLHHHVASRLYVEAVVSDQVIAFGNDQVGVLHDFQLLVTVVAVQPHALTDEFKNIHNAERPVTLKLARSAAHNAHVAANKRVTIELSRVAQKCQAEAGEFGNPPDIGDPPTGIKQSS
jgi:hypothetical protein